MRGVLPTLVVMLIMMLTGCSNDDDYRAPITPDTDYDYSFKYDGDIGYVYVIQEHTKGSSGFPIVIMADGYSQSDIDKGEYKKVVNNAVTAMLKQKPLKDLAEYLDIYEVVVASEHSGIDYSKHETAFKTYLESKQNTNVCGDSIKISNFTYGALRQDSERMHNALSIVLLNSADYAGVTLMALDTAVVDTIPQGWSLAYIPAYATVSNGDNVFEDLIMHEAIGHGIGKLADEYWYESAPNQEDIDYYKRSRKFGWSTNIKYFDDVTTGTIAPKYIYKADKTGRYYVHKTVDPEGDDDVMVPFANDSRYVSEEHKWVQGGYTFIKLTNDKCGQELEYIDDDGKILKVEPYLCESHFYRCSNLSIMGDVVTYADLEFNTVSRMAIYKRINRIANGSGWKFDYETFKKFDKGESTTKAANTIRTAPKLKPRNLGGNIKQLARPKLLKQWQ